MLRDRVVIPVIDYPELPQDIASDDRLDRPVVALLALALAIQPLNVEDLGAESLQYNADVLDAKVVLLIDRQLIDQKQKLLRSHPELVLHYRILRLGLGAVVLLMMMMVIVM